MTETIRSFIAIELPGSLHKELSEAETILRKSNADVKWVNPENIHITLKFLGNVTPEKIKEIEKLLDEFTKGLAPFSIEAKGLGAFPKLAYPRVIWAGIEDQTGKLKEIAENFDGAISKLGFEKENREFSAHLTLGRVRSPKNKEKLKEIIEKTPFLSVVDIKVDKIVLFKSTLTQSGSIYTKLYEALFKERN